MPKVRAAQARTDDDSLHGGGHETRDAAEVREHGGEEVRLPLKSTLYLSCRG